MRAYGIQLTDVLLGTVTTPMLGEVEINPRVHRFFQRVRRLHLMTDCTPEAVTLAIVQAIEHRQAVLVMPWWARYLYLPAPSLPRMIVRLLAA